MPVLRHRTAAGAKRWRRRVVLSVLVAQQRSLAIRVRHVCESAARSVHLAREVRDDLLAHGHAVDHVRGGGG